jgi:hypothetical protein
VRCLWCGVSSSDPNVYRMGCCAPDGDGHLFSLPDLPEEKNVSTSTVYPPFKVKVPETHTPYRLNGGKINEDR